MTTEQKTSTDFLLPEIKSLSLQLTEEERKIVLLEFEQIKGQKLIL